MDFKVTTLVNQNAADGRAGGFSESWYYSGTQAAAIAAFDTLAHLRAGMLTEAGLIVGGRIQEVGGAALALKRQIPGNLGTAQDIPQMAANCRCLGTGVGNKKYFQLRGVPDPTIAGGSIFPLGQFGQRFSAWGVALAMQGFKFRCRNLTAPKADVISIDANGVCVFGPGITFALNTYLQILRGRDVNGRSVAGTYYVSARVSDQACTLAAWKGVALATRAQVRAVGFTYAAVTHNSAEIMNVTTRKVGRSFGGYRGRARRR